MRERDTQHWLYRLSAEEWLTAASNELSLAEQALARRAVRIAVTHARRGAGMALNAFLRVTTETDWPSGWGRSYMEHVAGLAEDPVAPKPVQEAAALLRNTPPAPTLVQLGPPDRRPIEAARQILDWARSESASSIERDT